MEADLIIEAGPFYLALPKNAEGVDLAIQFLNSKFFEDALKEYAKRKKEGA